MGLKKLMSRGLWLLFSLWAPVALATKESAYNMPKGVTPISQEVYDLHMLIFWICVGIAVVVFGVLIYALVMHRKSRGVQAARFHEHAGLEVVWAIIPFVILTAMAIPATKTLIHMNDTRNSEITIKVIGHQWKWEYEYLDYGVHFFSNLKTPLKQIHNESPKGEHYLLEVDNPVVVPVNKKIRFLVTANDVIHSWWVPSLGFKRDGVPGFINESWATITKPGIYRGQCAELCGANHGFMPIVVKAVTQSEFDGWVASKADAKLAAVKAAAIASAKTYTMAELMAKGKKVYDTHCAACHKVDGTGMPPVFPAMKGGAISTGPVPAHITIVVKGKKGTAMQSFANQLSDVELAAVITYERNAWGNDTGDVVQPADVAKAR